MADISFKFRAEALGKTLENLSSAVEAEIKAAVKNLSHAAYASMAAKVQNMSMNSKNRQDYLRGLQFKDLGDDSYLIYLEGEWANKLEEGFAAYSIRQKMLNSNKIVKVGSRAGQPWVKIGKDGQKYAHVPFEHKPFAGGKAGDLAADIKNMTAKNAEGNLQGLTQVFKDASGNALSGKVASVPKWDKEGPGKNLAGMTKFQHVHPSGKVSSLYMTFRTVSEFGKDWTHPGFVGYNIFNEAERYVEREMDNIIKIILK